MTSHAQPLRRFLDCALFCLALAWLGGCLPNRTRDTEVEEPAPPGPVERERPDLATGRPAPREGDIFLHSAFTLYRFAPLAKTVTEVGAFDCMLADQSGSADSGMHDLAVDRDGRLFGVAKVGGQAEGAAQDHVIVSVAPESGRCWKELVLDRRLVDPKGTLEVRGLSFLPRGTLDPNEDTLVALEIGGAYLRVDLRARKATVLGSLNQGGAPGRWLTKGADLVSIEGAGTFSTAKQGGMDEERLVALDPQTGAVTRDLGALAGALTTFGGLGYWGGTLFGFTTEGRIMAIDPGTARTTLVVALAPAGARYDGAAVTTIAPIIVE